MRAQGLRAGGAEPAQIAGFATRLDRRVGGARPGAASAQAGREALAVIGGIETVVSEDNLSLLDLIASALDDAGDTEDALKLFKATAAFRNEPRRAIWAIYTARRACDWDFAARLEPLACTIGAA